MNFEEKKSSVIFRNFYLSNEKIEFECITIDEVGRRNKFDAHFILNGEFIPQNDNIAVALVSLVKRKFKQIIIDLDISESLIKFLIDFTKAEVIVRSLKSKNFNKSLKENIILSFSGGIDSLAAFYIMPEATKLVSIDFEDGYEREKNFFSKFNPYVLKTNVRKPLDIDHNSWEFMGIGAILYCDYLNAGYNVFGTILEANKENFSKFFTLSNINNTYPFSFIGLKDIRYINGITEVGTSIIASYYDPIKIADSLISLSNIGTEKRYRKETLMDIVSKKFNRNISFKKSIPPKYYRAKFGVNIALDFLCLYIIKNAGLDIAKNTMDNIPIEAVELAEKLDLTFYERINCSCLNGISFMNDNLRADMIKKVVEAGVYPYTEYDYYEYRQVANFLNKYHNFYKH